MKYNKKINQIKQIYEKDFHSNLEKDKNFIKNEFKLANQLEWIKSTAEKIEKENVAIQKILQQKATSSSIARKKKNMLKIAELMRKLVILCSQLWILRIFQIQGQQWRVLLQINIDLASSKKRFMRSQVDWQMEISILRPWIP